IRPRGQVVAAHVGRDDAEARRRERLDLPPPAVPELGEAVQQDDQRPLAGLDVVQLHVAGLGVAFTKPAEPVSLPRLFRRVLGCAHCYLPGVALGTTLGTPGAGSPQWRPLVR